MHPIQNETQNCHQRASFFFLLGVTARPAVQNRTLRWNDGGSDAWRVSCSGCKCLDVNLTLNIVTNCLYHNVLRCRLSYPTLWDKLILVFKCERMHVLSGWRHIFSSFAGQPPKVYPKRATRLLHTKAHRRAENV